MVVSIEHIMMAFQMVLGFVIPEVPEVVINRERDRKQHFEVYQKHKQDRKKNPNAGVLNQGENEHVCDHSHEVVAAKENRKMD